MGEVRLLVTGTDTGVGKTVVGAGLVAWARREGRSVAVLKPVESGAHPVAEDAALLARCAGLSRWQQANVVALPEPLAPVVAARRAGLELRIEALDAAVEALRGDLVLVEGAGGALVQVAPGVYVADLAERWGLRPVVVAANRLGMLSHTRLTVECLMRRGASPVVVVNSPSAAGGVPEQTNPDELRRTLPVPVLGPVPHLTSFTPEALADALADVARAILGDP